MDRFKITWQVFLDWSCNDLNTGIRDYWDKAKLLLCIALYLLYKRQCGVSSVVSVRK